jgi:hypothetical protein
MQNKVEKQRKDSKRVGANRADLLRRNETQQSETI